jgi:hypothetical protein
MPTYYHGTASTFLDSILKKGIARTLGHPRIDRGKLYVWMSPDFALAAEYAEIRAKSLATLAGSKFTVIKLLQPEPAARPGIGPIFSPFIEKFEIEKLEGELVDTSARPVVLAIELPDSWKVTPSPTFPGEWRCAHRIPPSMLTPIELPTRFSRYGAVDGAIEALGALQGLQALLGWA